MSWLEYNLAFDHTKKPQKVQQSELFEVLSFCLFTNLKSYAIGEFFA